MNLTSSVDNWIKGAGPHDVVGLVLMHVLVTFVTLMFCIMVGLAMYGDPPPAGKMGTILFIAGGVEHLFMIPLLIFLYHRISIINNLKLGARFSKLKDYSVRLLEDGTKHYISLCGCEKKHDYDSRLKCIHDEIKIPIDITDFKSQTRAIAKLESIYSRSVFAYENHVNHARSVEERLNEYKKDVQSRLLEYNKLSKELSA